MSDGYQPKADNREGTSYQVMFLKMIKDYQLSEIKGG